MNGVKKGLQLADIVTKNVGDDNLNTRMKYIMLKIDNWQRTLVKEGSQDIGWYAVKIVIYD